MSEFFDSDIVKEGLEDIHVLAKLPEPVRNKMGFAASGGPVKKMKNGGMAKCPRVGIAHRGRARAG